MPPSLLVAAHGTRSAAGLATTRSLVAAIAAVRPSVPVLLGFLDVVGPTLAEVLADRTDVVVVPLLLSAGYHVETDIPRTVAGRARIAAHLGPDPLIIDALGDRLAEARSAERVDPATTVLAAVPSSSQAAQREVALAAERLGARLGRPVLAIAGGKLPPGIERPVEVATYLLAEGTFLDQLRGTGAEVVAAAIGVHPSLVSLVWSRYDAALTGR